MDWKTGQFGRIGQLACFAFVLAGCTTMQDERVKLYKDDGVFLFAKGDYAGAQETFELALTFMPQDPVLVYNLGQCHDRRGDAKGAETYYLQALTLAPDNGEVRRAYVSLLYRTGRADQARS